MAQKESEQKKEGTGQRLEQTAAGNGAEFLQEKIGEKEKSLFGIRKKVQALGNMGIRGRLLLSVLVTVVVIFVAVSLLIYSKAKTMIVAELDSSLAHKKEQIRVEVNNLLQPASNSVELLNANAYVREYISQVKAADQVKSTDGYNELIRTLNMIKDTNANLLNVYIGLDAANKIVTHDELETPPDFKMKERDWYAVTSRNKRLTISDPYIDVSSGKTVIGVSTPILNDSGSLLGIASVDISTEKITQALSAFNYKGNGYAVLIDKSGKLIYHPNSDYVLKQKMADLGTDWKSVSDLMLQWGDDVVQTRLDGEPSYVSYAPAIDNQWSVALVVSQKDAEQALAQFQHIFVLSILAAIVVLSLLLYVVSNSILKPIPVLTKAFHKAMTGDLSVRARVTAKGEMGQLAEGFNEMISSQQNLIQGIIRNSHSISEAVDNTERNVALLDQGIIDVSAITEELSAGMQQTAASMQEMSASTAEIEHAVSGIALKAQAGAEEANAINERAEQLKETAGQSREQADRLFGENEERLRAAIEQSKSIAQIHTLSGAILEIASRTNLLSLNASIEAARAGDAGKGFAVVAEEIRKLADNSKDTVSEIQEVTQSVIGAVASLVEGAESMLRFVDGQVLKDYELMQETGLQYSRDAAYVEDLVTDLSATSEQLLASIQNMLSAIGETRIATQEGAEGASSIAAENEEMMGKSGRIVTEMEEIKQSSARLLETVSRFTA
ncbi:methyl-accepting chemotaxis protein [Paenibacillus albidus]|uniref:Methyl-accepting chemotaxis protein n=1 Tax=Paenibacillus albidus TaxID=2041023 RepID=A0A917CR23_9BACL|nr:methyl-accepting chemotaxis protein [Paenibacillus albidus]GGF96696.1 methyl-accepting chemotaxis protein [Paenibacillus albidus]